MAKQEDSFTYTYKGETAVELPDFSGEIDGGIVKPGQKITVSREISHPHFVDSRGKPAVADGATFDANADDAEQVRLASNEAPDEPAAETPASPVAEEA